MISVEDDGAGGIRVYWIQKSAPRIWWLLLAEAPDRLTALVEAERLVRADLRALHELLHAAKQAERR